MTMQERKPEMTPEIMSFRDYLLSSTISYTLDVWELKDLGHQTTQRIVHTFDPLQSMHEINQKFSNMVSSLSRTKLNNSIKDEIIANQWIIPPDKSLMAMNGALINIEYIDLYLYLAKILTPEGSNDVPVGQPIAITVEELDDIKSVSTCISSGSEAKEEKPTHQDVGTQISYVDLPSHTVLGMPALDPSMNQGNVAK